MNEFFLAARPYIPDYSTGKYMLDELAKSGTVTPIGDPTTTPGDQWMYKDKGTIFMPTGSGYKIGGDSYPGALWIDDKCDFEISGNFYVTNTGLKILFGNLRDNLGYGHIWLALNDPTNWGVALYGSIGVNNTGKYAWLQGSKFPANRWVYMKIQRVDGVISCTIDTTVQATKYTYAGGFMHHNFPLHLGLAEGGGYSYNGYINDFKFIVTRK